MLSQLLGFDLAINMDSVNRPLRRAQMIHIANCVYHKTFLHISTLAEHVFFELFQFHSPLFQHNLDQSR